MGSKRRPGAPADLEELHPNRFAVHNPAVGPSLRGEGEREGDRFLLTTWRRDGFIARVRAKSFLVLTLADQIAALPNLPPATPPGRPSTRVVAAGERISYFADHPLGWQPAPPAPDQPDAVTLREGWVIWRRKGRGPGSYAHLLRSGFQPLSHDEALRHGLAQVALAGTEPIRLTQIEAGWLLPELPLPSAHRGLLGRLGERRADGTLLSPVAIPLAAMLLQRLGLTLQSEAA